MSPAKGARAAYCRQGHSRAPENLRSDGQCRECARRTGREYRRRERAAKYGVPVEFFGEREGYLDVRRVRERLGMTRAELASRTGLSEETIRTLEPGPDGTPRSRGNPTTRYRLLGAVSECIANRSTGRYARLLRGLAEAERRGDYTTATAARIAGYEPREVRELWRHLRGRGLADYHDPYGNRRRRRWHLTEAGRRLTGAPVTPQNPSPPHPSKGGARP